MSSQPAPVAAFDLDGTLTRRDTLLPFLTYLVGWTGMLARSPTLLPILAAYAAGLLSNSRAKEIVFDRFLTGRPLVEFNRICERFARDRLPGVMRPRMLTRLGWHRRRGHRCVIVSASMENYILPWARTAGFEAVIATRLETADGLLTGRYDGANCHGTEKARRLLAWLGQRDGCEIYAYGDSRGDREMLALADHAFYRITPEEEPDG